MESVAAHASIAASQLIYFFVSLFFKYSPTTVRFARVSRVLAAVILFIMVIGLVVSSTLPGQLGNNIFLSCGAIWIFGINVAAFLYAYTVLRPSKGPSAQRTITDAEKDVRKSLASVLRATQICTLAFVLVAIAAAFAGPFGLQYAIGFFSVLAFMQLFLLMGILILLGRRTRQQQQIQPDAKPPDDASVRFNVGNSLSPPPDSAAAVSSDVLA